MKKTITLLLALAMGLTFCACGDRSSAENAAAEKKVDVVSDDVLVAENVQIYAPGITVKTNFGEITVLDAAFCAKAQLIDALPRPSYDSAGDGRIVFAMRTQISNVSDADLVLMDDFEVSIEYSEENSFGCSKGGNYKSSDPRYTILSAGASDEYILCGKVPVELVQTKAPFFVDFQNVQLGFTHEEIQVYNCMGYQEGDNLLTSLEDLIALSGTAPADTKQESDETAADPSKLAFALEDVRYERTNSYVAIEVKIRNNSDVPLLWPVFNGVILDANGDILENCSYSYSNGLEAGQAGWEAIRISEPTTLGAMDSIKLITVWYKEDPQSLSHNLRFDLPAPFVIAVNAQMDN